MIGMTVLMDGEGYGASDDDECCGSRGDDEIGDNVDGDDNVDVFPVYLDFITIYLFLFV